MPADEQSAQEALRRYSAGDLQGAATMCLGWLAANPNDVDALNLLGKCRLDERRFGEAIQSFEHATKLKPELGNLHFNLCLAYQGAQRFPEALRAAKRAYRLNPQHSVCANKLGQLLMLNRRNAEAIGVLEEALARDEDYLPIQLNLAQAYLDEGDESKAEALATAVLEKNPHEIAALRILGRLHHMAGDFEQSRAAYALILAQNPDDAQANHMHVNTRRMTEADRPLVERLETLGPGLPPLPAEDQKLLAYAIGKGWTDLGEYERAWSAYERANRLAASELERQGVTYSSEFEAAKTRWRKEAFASKLPAVSANTDTTLTPIFIVGMIRSGTTLVEQILANHSSVAAGGELPFWLQNEVEMVQEMHEGRWNAATWATRYRSVLEGIANGKPYVTDKMPLNYAMLGFILSAFPHAKIVHCQRDPLDVCLSVYVTPYRTSPVFGHSLENIARAYLDYSDVMEHWRSVISPSSLYEISYESLVTKPDHEVGELLAWLGLPWEEACLHPEQGRGPVSTPSNWAVRQPMHSGAIGRWRPFESYLEPVRKILG